jgi:release factor glutamine methyltransferase
VREWEPRVAVVDAGQTGRLVLAARDVLATGGALVLETHEAKGAEVAAALHAAGYDAATITKDLAGRERVVEARWGATQSRRR